MFNNTGSSNTAIGSKTLYSNTIGSSNTANGYQALYKNISGYQNTAIGFQALYSNTTSEGNTATGRQALYYNTTGRYNTASGVNALYSNTTGEFNTAAGFDALYFNTTGNANTAIGTGALYNNSTGSHNAALGLSAGYGAPSTNFDQSTFVGASTYPTVGRTNVTMLGYGVANGQITNDDQMAFGNTAIYQLRAQVSGITTYSDARFKNNIKEDVKGLDFIKRLKPVTYNENPEILHQIWGTPDSLVKKIDHSDIKSTRFIGFIAQDVEKAAQESGFEFTGIDAPKNDKEVYSLRYTDFIMPMVKAIQELNIENEALKNQNEALEKRLERLENLLSK